MENIFIARQPIFNAQLNVFAYELLFRSDQNNAANVLDGESATTNVIINALTEIGMDQLVGPHLAFINLTRSHLITLSELPLDEIKDKLVLEILEDIQAEDVVVKAVTKLSKDGFTIALDDFIYHEKLQPLVELSDIIKIDLMALTARELEEQVKILANGKRKLLAEKVETQEEFDRCKTLGFDFFQGYFFSKPNIVSGHSLPANKLAIIKLLAKFQETESSAEELASIITQDVTLSLRILRYINSAQFGLGKKVNSIQQAIMMLGRNTIRNLANLVAMSQIENKPHELLIISMTRAKMAENLARQHKADKETCFTMGLFSVIDSLMDQDMQTLMNNLPLADEIKNALLHYKGKAGTILQCVLAYESGDWENSVFEDYDINECRDSYIDALNWASASEFLLKTT